MCLIKYIQLIYDKSAKCNRSIRSKFHRLTRGRPSRSVHTKKFSSICAKFIERLFCLIAFLESCFTIFIHHTILNGGEEQNIQPFISLILLISKISLPFIVIILILITYFHAKKSLHAISVENTVRLIFYVFILSISIIAVYYLWFTPIVVVNQVQNHNSSNVEFMISGYASIPLSESLWLVWYNYDTNRFKIINKHPITTNFFGYWRTPNTIDREVLQENSGIEIDAIVVSSDNDNLFKIENMAKNNQNFEVLPNGAIICYALTVK